MENKFNFDAVLWDFDGTIADTEYIHAQIEVDILVKYGINISKDEIVKRFTGISLKTTFTKLFEENNVDINLLDEACELKWKLMNESVKNNIPPFMPGAKQLLEKLYENNVKMALATSSSSKSYVYFLLDALLILDKFQFIITGNEVTKGKPDPEIFIKSANALGVKSEKCLVIEDGNAGVLAAQSGNMKCIAVGDHIDKSILTKNSVYIETLEKVDLEFISKRF